MTDDTNVQPATAADGDAPVQQTLFAQRGSQRLMYQDLRVHLATLIRLENVGVLLGSGASKDVGGRTTRELWKDFTIASEDKYKWLRDNLFLPAQTELHQNTPDYEKLADSLAIAALDWGRSKNQGLADLQEVRADLARAVIRASLLQDAWWKDGSAVDWATRELRDHRELLQKLTAARQPGQPAPWVFTTNYDLAVEWAAESIGLKLINGFDGLHRRGFSSHNFDLGWRNVLARGEARFGTYHAYLAKVHGSLSWHTRASGIVESAAESRWPRLEAFLGGSTSDLDSFLILPSVTKYEQTVGYVLGELIRRFSEFLARPQTCLLTVGYSFSDEHVNRLIMTGLQNPTMQLVIYVPEARAADDSVSEPASRSNWARLVALGSPRVTVVGGGSHAYFRSFVRDLPDPAIYDDNANELRRRLSELSGGIQ